MIFYIAGPTGQPYIDDVSVNAEPLADFLRDTQAAFAMKIASYRLLFFQGMGLKIPLRNCNNSLTPSAQVANNSDARRKRCSRLSTSTDEKGFQLKKALLLLNTDWTFAIICIMLELTIVKCSMRQTDLYKLPLQSASETLLYNTSPLDTGLREVAYAK